MSLAKQLKALLKRDGITVAQLAKKTGISAKSIYHYLEGRMPRNLEHIRKICEAFNVSSDYLLFGVQSKVAPGEELIPFGLYDVFLKKRVIGKDEK